MIEINNLTANKVDEKFLKGVAKKVLKGENREEADLSVVLVGQGRMRNFNKKYRGENRVTDVLSFGEGLNPHTITNTGAFSTKMRSLCLFGVGVNEIVICLKEVKKNAKRYKIKFKEELARVLIHGILHILGHEHSEKMQEKEKYYLKELSSS